MIIHGYPVVVDLIRKEALHVRLPIVVLIRHHHLLFDVCCSGLESVVVR